MSIVAPSIPMHKASIVKSSMFKSSHDLLSLGIIDWSRDITLSYWDNHDEAIEAIAGWLVGTARYTIVRADMTIAPKRDDWHGKVHVGTHDQLSFLYWNWFHWKKRGTLTFNDSPDFQGTLAGVPGVPDARFWGDSGIVSASTFNRTLKVMDAHDLWISIVDSDTQVVIEPLVSYRQLWSNWVDRELLLPNVDAIHPEQRKIGQMGMF